MHLQYEKQIEWYGDQKFVRIVFVLNMISMIQPCHKFAYVQRGFFQEKVHNDTIRI